MTMLLNFLALKLGWLISVSAASQQLAWIGPSLIGLLALAYLLNSTKPGAELSLIGAAMLLGTLWESLVLASGAIGYAGSTSVVPPLWIVGLWALFALSLTRSLAWMQARLLLAALVGALIVPASYFAGAALGAAEIAAPIRFFVLQGIGWSMLLPGLLWAARRFVTPHPSAQGVNDHA